MHAPAGAVGRQARRPRGRWSDAEIGTLITRIGKHDPRADREDISVAIPPDPVGADGTHQSLVTANAFEKLSAKTDGITRVIVGECSYLQRRRNLADRRAYVGVLAAPADIRGGSKGEATAGEPGNARTPVGCLGLELVTTVRNFEVEHRRQFGGVSSDALG